MSYFLHESSELSSFNMYIQNFIQVIVIKFVAFFLIYFQDFFILVFKMAIIPMQEYAFLFHVSFLFFCCFNVSTIYFYCNVSLLELSTEFCYFHLYLFCFAFIAFIASSPLAMCFHFPDKFCVSFNLAPNLHKLKSGHLLALFHFFSLSYERSIFLEIRAK
jgi:hypothetical protein